MQRVMDKKVRNRLAGIASLKPDSFVTVTVAGYEDLPEEFLPKVKLRPLSDAAVRKYLQSEFLTESDVEFCLTDGENNGIIGWNENFYESESLRDENAEPVSIPFSKENIKKLDRRVKNVLFNVLRDMLFGVPEEKEGLESSPLSKPDASASNAEPAPATQT